MPPGRGPAAEIGRVLAALDVGSTKISCLIAEVTPAKHRMPGGEARPSLRILGLGHQASRGIRAGSIVD
ncbi:MAG TPA: cell division protein FtsA, partial [Aestuariivirga sp.]|nr:cell division protein FtsA [Aestuariivirga sp.]